MIVLDQFITPLLDWMAMAKWVQCHWGYLADEGSSCSISGADDHTLSLSQPPTNPLCVSLLPYPRGSINPETCTPIPCLSVSSLHLFHRVYHSSPHLSLGRCAGTLWNQDLWPILQVEALVRIHDVCPTRIYPPGVVKAPCTHFRWSKSLLTELVWTMSIPDV